MSRRPWMPPPYVAPRTSTTGRLGATSRAALELRWEAAIADPEAWRAKQLADAATALHRTPDDVLNQWGLA